MRQGVILGPDRGFDIGTLAGRGRGLGDRGGHRTATLGFGRGRGLDLTFGKVDVEHAALLGHASLSIFAQAEMRWPLNSP